MRISGIEVNKTHRNEGIAESALRQLPTYIRKTLIILKYYPLHCMEKITN